MPELTPEEELELFQLIELEEQGGEGPTNFTQEELRVEDKFGSFDLVPLTPHTVSPAVPPQAPAAFAGGQQQQAQFRQRDLAKAGVVDSTDDDIATRRRKEALAQRAVFSQQRKDIISKLKPDPDRKTPGTLVRARAGIKDPAAIPSFLNEEFGEENVVALPDETGQPDNFLIRSNPGVEEWAYFDPPRFGAGRDKVETGEEIVSDAVSDNLGTLIRTAAPVIGSLATANPLVGSAIGAGLAGTALETAGALGQGDDQRSLGDRVQSVMTDVALEPVAEAGSLLLNQAVKRVSPLAFFRNRVTRGAAGRLNPTDVAEMEFLQYAKAAGLPNELLDKKVVADTVAEMRKHGLTPSVGQATGAPLAIKMEDFFRAHPASAQIMREFDLKNAGTFVKSWDSLMNRAVGPDVGGDNAVRMAAEARDKYMKKEFKAAIDRQAPRYNEAFLQARGSSIDMSDFRAHLDQMISSRKATAGSEERKGLLKRLNEIKDDLDGQGGRMDLRDFQNSLSDSGAHKVTQDNTYIKITDRDMADEAADEIHGFLKNKLLEEGYKGTNGVRKLLEARWHTFVEHEALRSMNDVVLDDAVKRITNESWSGFLSKISKGGSFSDEQIETAMKRLADIDKSGQAIGGLRRAAMETIFNKTSLVSEKAASSGFPISPSRWAATARKHDKRIRALFAGDTAALKEYDEVIRGVNRLNRTEMADGSRTAIFQMLRGIPLAAAAIAKGDIGFGINAMAAILAPRAIAKAMVSKQGRLDLGNVLAGALSEPGVVNRSFTRLLKAANNENATDAITEWFKQGGDKPKKQPTVDMLNPRERALNEAERESRAPMVTQGFGSKI